MLLLILSIYLFSVGNTILGIICIVGLICSFIFLLNPYMFSKMKEPDMDWFKYLPLHRKILFILCFICLLPLGPG